MPKGTRVEKMYKALRKQGYTPEEAAKIAQKKTGQSLETGKKPKKD